MATTERQLPADLAAAFERFPAARERFEAMPAERQDESLAWIDQARGRRARAARIDETVQRLSPWAAAADEEVAEPVAPPPERGWWIWLVLLLLVVVVGLVLWFLLFRGHAKTTVPNVVGLRAPDAAARLHSAHLKDLPLTAPSKVAPLGTVFSEQPSPGARVNRDSTVRISISSGPARSAVPNVTDLPLAQATAKVTAAGLTAKVAHHASTRPKGVVFAQQPLPGVTAVKGAAVILDVSTGVKPVSVPSVVGGTQGAAVTALTRLGLRPRLQNVPSVQPAGQVVAQKPAPGTAVDKGSTVLLNVSSGAGGTTTAQTTTTAAPSTVAVPRVRGLAFTTSLRRLNAAGFRPLVRYVASTQRAGFIVAQRPAGGAAPSGSRVRVSVSTGPNPPAAIPVPDVVGQDQASAASTLRQAGFRVLVLFRKTTDQTQDGLVVDEQPPANASIPRGSFVAIFVGRFA